jgi:hypothetical protein
MYACEWLKEANKVVVILNLCCVDHVSIACVCCCYTILFVNLFAMDYMN